MPLCGIALYTAPRVSIVKCCNDRTAPQPLLAPGERLQSKKQDAETNAQDATSSLAGQVLAADMALRCVDAVCAAHHFFPERRASTASGAVPEAVLQQWLRAYEQMAADAVALGIPASAVPTPGALTAEALRDAHKRLSLITASFLSSGL